MDENRVKLRGRETVRSFKHAGNDIGEMDYLAVKAGRSWKLYRPFTALIFGASDDEIQREEEKEADGKAIRNFNITFKKELDVMTKEYLAAIKKGQGKSIDEVLRNKRRVKVLAERFAKRIKDGEFETRAAAHRAYEAALKDSEAK